MFIRRRDSSASAAPQPPPQSINDDAAAGLDPSLIASFPTFTYSWVKKLHAGRCGLECAVCLSEFQDDDVLRLLAACSHVFHTDCIDVWLTSHTTCPYCRRHLNPADKKSSSSLPEVRIEVAEAVDVREVFEETRGGGRGGEEEGNERRGEEGTSSGDWKKMGRSNSTGHSSWGRGDRYTLRLPKDVRERIAGERNWTRSCIDFRHLFGDHDDAREEDRQIGRSGLSEGGTSSRM
ncbi:hypothetical protein ACLOJK_025413 [Asimina triloba]